MTPIRIHLHSHTENNKEQIYGLVWNAQDAIRLRKDHRILGGYIGSLPHSPNQNKFKSVPFHLLTEQVYVLLKKEVDGTGSEFEFVDWNECVGPASEEQIGVFRQMEDAAMDEFKRQRELKRLNGNVVHWKTRHPVTIPTVSMDLPWYKPALIGRQAMMDVLQKIERLSQESCLLFEWLYGRQWFMSSGTKFGGSFMVYPRDPMQCHASYILKITSDSTVDPMEIVRSGRLGTMTKKQFVFGYWDSVKNGPKFIGINWTRF